MASAHEVMSLQGVLDLAGTLPEVLPGPVAMFPTRCLEHDIGYSREGLGQITLDVDAECARSSPLFADRLRQLIEHLSVEVGHDRLDDALVAVEKACEELYVGPGTVLLVGALSRGGVGVEAGGHEGVLLVLAVAGRLLLLAWPVVIVVPNPGSGGLGPREHFSVSGPEELGRGRGQNPAGLDSQLVSHCLGAEGGVREVCSVLPQQGHDVVIVGQAALDVLGVLLAG